MLLDVAQQALALRKPADAALILFRHPQGDEAIDVTRVIKHTNGRIFGLNFSLNPAEELLQRRVSLFLPRRLGHHLADGIHIAHAAPNGMRHFLYRLHHLLELAMGLDIGERFRLSVVLGCRDRSRGQVVHRGAKAVDDSSGHSNSEGHAHAYGKALHQHGVGDSDEEPSAPREDTEHEERKRQFRAESKGRADGSHGKGGLRGWKYARLHASPSGQTLQ